MTQPLSEIAIAFRNGAAALNPKAEAFAVIYVDALLAQARASAASDIHIQPTGSDQPTEILWRVDGVLHLAAILPVGREQIVARLKVMAELLTYRLDVPQEGRIRIGDEHVEMRLSTFPTIHGEKAVVRLFIASGQYRTLDDLGLPADIAQSLRRQLEATSGVILVTGPAGSGKTTTLYACLRQLQSATNIRRSIASLEDPVEAILPGVAQSQINNTAGFTYAKGLRSLLRQDPEIIMVGEIRDRETAETVFQASLTGHLVLTSFHAGSSTEAISRLTDMGVEPYVLRSGLRAILSQRLARRLCKCRREVDSSHCENCRGTGYSGRALIAEFVVPEEANLREAILSRSDSTKIERSLQEAKIPLLHDRAAEAVTNQLTSQDEVHRILGIR